MQYIYTVTTIRNKEANKHNRTVGWFVEQEKAFRCLDENWGDLIESGYYQYAVVEKVPSGLYPDTLSEDGDQRRWFWQAFREGDKEFWKRIDSEPDELKPEGAGGWTSYCEIG